MTNGVCDTDQSTADSESARFAKTGLPNYVGCTHNRTIGLAVQSGVPHKVNVSFGTPFDRSV